MFRLKVFECDNCDFYGRESICDECRKKNTPHHDPVTDEDWGSVIGYFTCSEEEE